MLVNVCCFVADNVHLEKQLFDPLLVLNSEVDCLPSLGAGPPHLQVFTTPPPPHTHTPFHIPQQYPSIF